MDNLNKRDTGPGAHADDYDAPTPVKAYQGATNFLLKSLRLVFTVISFGSRSYIRLRRPCFALKKIPRNLAEEFEQGIPPAHSFDHSQAKRQDSCFHGRKLCIRGANV